MKKILIVIVLFITSCSSAQLKNVEYQIDPEFDYYVQNFINASRGLVKEEDFEYVTIHFADLEGVTAGTCAPMPFHQKILIDRGWWLRSKSQFEREELLFHELGHCVLFRDHAKPTGSDNFWGWLERLSFKLGIIQEYDLLADGCPGSYMHPILVDESCIHKHYEYYIDELFELADPDEYKEEVIKYTEEYGL